MSPPLFATENPCLPLLVRLRTPSQRAFNTRVLNAMARFIDKNRGHTSPRGEKARTFEDAVLEVYLQVAHDETTAANRLSELLDVPSEVAAVVLAFYDLDGYYRVHSEARQEVASRISDYFPLPDGSARIALNGGSIVDTWSLGLARHSPARSQFEDWKAGRAPASVNREPGQDDGFWWKDIVSSSRTIQASQKMRPSPDLDAFLVQESGRLWQLYGALVERELIKSQKGTLIPGTAITVGGKKHADGWGVRYENRGGAQRLILETFLESKASFLGVARAQDQIRGFLSRLIENPHRIFLFGEYVRPETIFLQTKAGPVALLDFAKQNSDWIKGGRVDATFTDRFQSHFPEDTFQIVIPHGEPRPPIPVGRYADTDSSRADLQTGFARLVQKRYAPAGEDPVLFRDRLFSLSRDLRPLPPEWEQHAFFRRTGNSIPVHITTPQEWTDPENGGLRGILILPSYTLELEGSLAGLTEHLSDEVQTRLRTQYPVYTFDSSTARETGVRHSPLAAGRIRSRLAAIIQAHNDWVAESPGDRTPIPADSLASRQGVESAITVLQKTANLKKHFIWLSDFVDLKTGGILGLKILPAYSVDSTSTFRDLAAHLPEATQNFLEEAHPVEKADASRAMNTSRSRSPGRIRDRFEALVKAHNEWAREVPAERTMISLKDLAFKEGAEQAFEILQRASGEILKRQQISEESSRHFLPLSDFADPRTGSIRGIRNLPSLTRGLDVSLGELAAHLPPNERVTLETDFPVSGTDAARALLPNSPNQTAATRIRNRLEAQILAHNRWAEGDPIRVSIALDSVKTDKGMENAIAVLQKASEPELPKKRLENESSHHILPLENSFHGKAGWILGIKKLPHYGTQLGDSLHDLAAHLSEADQAKLLKDFPVKNSDGSASLARLGFQPPLSAERIQNRLEALIRAHNRWAELSPTTRDTISTEGIATQTGIEKALQILQTAAAPVWRERSQEAERRSHFVFLEDFTDAEAGGLLAIKSLPSYSKKMDEALRNLAAHLPEADNKILESTFAVSKNSGATALSKGAGSRTAATHIRDRLEALISAHNEWAALSPSSRDSIPLDKLGTRAGMENALGVLRKASEPVLLALAKEGERQNHVLLMDEFTAPQTGGILGLKVLPRSSFKLAESLAALSTHLPKESRENLRQNFPVLNSDLSTALKPEAPSPTAALRIRNRIEALVLAHNAWASESPASRESISIDALRTKAGTENAMRVLQEARGRLEN